MHICEPWLAVTNNFVPKKNVALGPTPKRAITQAHSLLTPPPEPIAARPNSTSGT